MMREIAGGKCEFLILPGSKLTLHPIAFGCCRSCSNKRLLHSYLGKAFAGNYGINKLPVYVWGARFTWGTDCFGVRFILTYDGSNPAVLRVQMRLMCSDMIIVHRPGSMLSTPDYLSRLGADLHFSPLVRDYINCINRLCSADPPISSLPMCKENMPGYRKPQKSSTYSIPIISDSAAPLDASAQAVLASIFIDDSNGRGEMLSHVPVLFGSFESTINLTAVHRSSPLYNNELIAAARYIIEFQWAIYSFNSGHFLTAIQRESLPFCVTLAVDPLLEGCSCCKDFAKCQRVLSPTSKLLNHIRSSGDTSPLNGYLIHSPVLSNSANAPSFWQLQTSIVTQLRLIRGLPLFLAFLPADSQSKPVIRFISALEEASWTVSSSIVHCGDFGDCYDSELRVLIGCHRNCYPNLKPVSIPTPPSTLAQPLGAFIWQPFNTRSYAISYAKSSTNFGKQL